MVAIACTVLLSIFLNQRFKMLRYANGAQVRRFSSLPIHYSYCFILWSLIFVALVAFAGFKDIFQYIFIASFLLINFFIIKKLYNQGFAAKNHLEKFTSFAMFLTALIGILITIAITLSIFFEAIKFFKITPFFDFIFGLKWNPQMAVHAEQSVTESHFGVVPVLLGTLLITAVAMLISIPIGILAAIYLGFYAKSKIRDYLKPILEILAGVPTVVYGYFAVSMVAPFFKNNFALVGVDIASESALAAGFVMGIMIIPFVLSLVDDALNSVPQALKDAALALGSTKSEMIKKVVMIAAMPSVIGAVILAFSRAIGETMIVVMAAGLVANLTINPLDSVTTATAQIVTLLVGDQEFDSPKTLAAFALALVLFVMTFIFNIVALVVMKKYKK